LSTVLEDFSMFFIAVRKSEKIIQREKSAQFIRAGEQWYGLLDNMIFLYISSKRINKADFHFL